MENNKAIVYNIFKDFFGEDKVDLQGSYIIVHFPKLTVKNEFDESIDISHLWVRINIDNDGTVKGTFQMIRSEYTYAQFISGYSHSHIMRQCRNSYLEWHNPCLGKGPIKTTLTNLAAHFSEELWSLFCLELSKYVVTESVEGTPYIRMSSVSEKQTKSKIYFDSDYNSNDVGILKKDIISNFLKYVILKRPFKFNYANGNYGIALSTQNIVLILSQLFVEYYNNINIENKPTIIELIQENVLVEVKYENGAFYSLSTSKIATNSINDSVILIFKSTPIKLKILNPKRNNFDNIFCILKCSVAKAIIHKLLEIVNSTYGKSINPGEKLYYI